MNLFAPPRCFDPNCPELLDRPGVDRALVREELQLLEKMNKRSGGHQLVLGYLQQLVDASQLASLSILDLGTGIADIPRAIVTWARQRELPITITAVDGNPNVLQIAQEACRDWSEIRLEQHDLLTLPYAKESFDLVLCSLALHHFAAADAVMILRRMQDMARIRYLVNDLRRNWMAIFSTELLTRVAIQSEIFRHDATQSCRAAFTVCELQELARQADLRRFQINCHHWCFRMVLEGTKSMADAPHNPPRCQFESEASG